MRYNVTLVIIAFSGLELGIAFIIVFILCGSVFLVSLINPMVFALNIFFNMLYRYIILLFLSVILGDIYLAKVCYSLIKSLLFLVSFDFYCIISYANPYSPNEISSPKPSISKDNIWDNVKWVHSKDKVIFKQIEKLETVLEEIKFYEDMNKSSTSSTLEILTKDLNNKYDKISMLIAVRDQYKQDAISEALKLGKTDVYNSMVGGPDITHPSIIKASWKIEK